MVCGHSFYCKKCRRTVRFSRGSHFDAVRRHYWSHHRPSMMKKKKKKRR